MLSEERNEILTRVGKGTPLGELLRRYWYPVAFTSDLDDFPMKQVRLLGEDLVVFKLEDGRYGLLEELCPHRRASLAYGVTEPEGIRCGYHGWLFAPDGRCLEQPAEPPDSTFKDRITATAYPTQELGGMVWGYLGPAPVPELPRFDLFTWDDVMTTAREARQRNIVEAGKGYYHRPVQGPDWVQWYRSFGGRDFDPQSGKLVFNKAAALRYYRWLRAGVDGGVIERDRLNGDWNRFFQPIADGRVLFFSGGTWNWAEMEQQWVGTKGGEQWLFENLGFAPHPSYQKGGKPITLSNPQAYFLSAKSQNKEIVMRLLAYTTVPDLDAKHAIGSAHLPVLRRTAELVRDRFLKEVSYLLNYTTFLPPHPDLPKWQDAFFRGISAVESLSATPEQAVEVVAAEMQRTIGDKIIVE
ncbi:MAG: extracellular solute-binding protein [Armatimonadota bacterium]|nr:extracellular solute-binding protein [Armatimonadota bacterium]